MSLAIYVLSCVLMFLEGRLVGVLIKWRIEDKRERHLKGLFA